MFRHHSELYINYLIRVSFPDNTGAGISQLEHFIESRPELTSEYRGFADQLAILRAERGWLDANFDWLAEWFAKANKAHQDQNRAANSHVRYGSYVKVQKAPSGTILDMELTRLAMKEQIRQGTK